MVFVSNSVFYFGSGEVAVTSGGFEGGDAPFIQSARLPTFYSWFSIIGCTKFALFLRNELSKPADKKLENEI